MEISKLLSISGKRVEEASKNEAQKRTLSIYYRLTYLYGGFFFCSMVNFLLGAPILHQTDGVGEKPKHQMMVISTREEYFTCSKAG